MLLGGIAHFRERYRMHPRSLLALLLLVFAIPAFCQVQPSAYRGGLPGLSVGAGASGFNPDFGRGRLYGGTLWIDYSLQQLPSFLRGVGVELEARDISLDRQRTQPVTRIDSIGAGVTYTVLKYGNFQPYAKGIFGLGNVDYLVTPTRRYNQSRTLSSFGGGFDYRAYRTIWVRVDYEYQYLPDFFFGNPNRPTHAPLDPQGFTVGAMYRFGRKASDR
jgi:opacity protein-like surface antigen